MGAQIIKTYYVEKVLNGLLPDVRYPLLLLAVKTTGARGAGNVLAGYRSGRFGVDMGRNIFQSDHPVAMMKAYRRWFTITKRLIGHMNSI